VRAGQEEEQKAADLEDARREQKEADLEFYMAKHAHEIDAADGADADKEEGEEEEEEEEEESSQEGAGQQGAGSKRMRLN
jgi:hypothetical protein